MRRLIPLLGAVLALAFSSTAAADTFRVERPHGGGGGSSAGTVAFARDATVVPFNAAQNGPMSFAALRSIWQAAGNTYGIPWEVLAAINKVETDFGRNLGPSSAGAIGWMQFMPSTWARWGIDANGDGVADPDNPTDAIFSAAHYLAGCGGQFNISAAVYCYNHATWYVNEVLGLAAVYSQGGGGDSLFAVDQLQPRIDSASTRIHSGRAQLANALAQARALEDARRPFLQKASSARLLSDQLEARKHAVQLGARRDAVETRVARLRKLLDTATMQLGRLRDQANAASLGSSTLLSTPLTSGAYGGVVSIAMQYLGVPYLWAGATPSGFDCSGLVQYAFGQIGISLPHNTVAQWNYPGAVSVPRNQLQPGDLVFFNKLDHVGIYIGNGQFIDAPHTGSFVRVDNLSDAWYTANYDGAKRIVGSSIGSVTQLGGATTAFTTSESTNTVAFTPETVYFTR
jgi:cell wall-associated NlpC family hydrolase